MTKFKVNDRVRRIKYKWGGVAPGDISTVTEVTSPGNIILTADPSKIYLADNFELVSPGIVNNDYLIFN